MLEYLLEKLKILRNRKKLIIGLGHPAHFHLFKHIITSNQFEVIVVISDKDILADLLISNQITFIKIADYGKYKNLFSKALKILFSSFKLIQLIRKEKPNLLIGCLTQLSWAGWVCNRKILFFAEDDYAYTKMQGKITYPFVTKIITAEGVNVGPYASKQLTYPSYQKLAYLSPEVFQEKPKGELLNKYKLAKQYFLIRLVNLSAHHDKNIKGIGHNELDRILKDLLPFGDIIISSEKPLDKKWSEFQPSLDVNDMHHLMKHAKGFISDSQSMTVEAALLGTPNVKINDFKDKISILSELEYSFQLTKSFKPNTITSKDLKEFASEDLEIWRERRKALLKSKVNPIPIYISLINQHLA